MKIPKISVGIVLFRGEHFLEKCFKSLLKQQNSEEIELLFCDHSPKKEAQKYLKKHFSGENFQIFSRTGNHSEGQNFLLEKAKGKFYFCGSFDAEYSPDFFQNLLKCAEQKKECGIFSPKILLLENPKKIDSAGIARKSFFRFVDRGHGEKDDGKYDTPQTIFGATGAAFLARKKTLERIKNKNGFFFDPALHYKNDIDLAFRAQKIGIKTHFCPTAKMLHNRGTQRKNQKTRENSFFGHRVIFSKFARSPEDFLGQYARDLCAIFWAPKSFLQFWKWKKNQKK